MVAYIDILGFSKAVEQANDNEYKVIENLLRTFSQYNRNFEIHDTKTFPPMQSVITGIKEGSHTREIVPVEVIEEISYSSDPSITSFSDHVVISEPTLVNCNGENDDFYLSCVCNNIINAISRFGYLCLLNGFLIRGAIVAGKFTHDQNVIFGVPLIRAHHLESEEAGVPRILVDKSAEFIIQSAFYNTNDFYIDTDKKHYFDWLGNSPINYLNHQFPPNHPDETTHMFNFLGDIITKKLFHYKLLSSNSGEDYKIYQKWKWFAERFNLSAPKIIGNPHNRAVSFEPVIVDY